MWPGLKKWQGGGRNIRTGEEQVEEAAETRDYIPFLCHQRTPETSGKAHASCASITTKVQPKQRVTACYHLQLCYMLKWQVWWIQVSTPVLNQMHITLAQRTTPCLCLVCFLKKLGIHNHAPCTLFCRNTTSAFGTHLPTSATAEYGWWSEKTQKILCSQKFYENWWLGKDETESNHAVRATHLLKEGNRRKCADLQLTFNSPFKFKKYLCMCLGQPHPYFTF